MKTKCIILLITCFCLGTNAEAQIFKKLKEKITNTILSKEIDNQNKGSDSLVKNTRGEPSPIPTDNNIKLPDSYQFSYNATMQLKNNQGTVATEYYLQPNETYYAKKQVSKDFTQYVVYDNQRNMEVSFFEVEESKISARKKMDFFTKAKMVGAYRDAPNRVVKSIGTKTLLGYKCEGYEISTDAGITQLWVTNEAPATIYSALFASRADEVGSPFNKNTMVMETTFTSVNNPTDNYHLQCTQLQPNIMEFNINNYNQ